MTVLNSEANLREPSNDLIFCKIVHRLSALLDLILEITTVDILHNDTKISIPRLVDFSEFDYIRMTTQHFHNLCLFQSFFLLLII